MTAAHENHSEAYFLRSFVGAAIPITNTEAYGIITALDSAFAQVAYEELWEAVVQNFMDLERDVLHHALDDMLVGGQDWNHFQDMRTSFSRRLSNLLSSCRAYIDLAPRQLRLIGAGLDFGTLFKTQASKAYDESFSYRLMEALRNYTQHYGSPITGTHLDNRRMDQNESSQLRHVTAASIDAKKLLEDPKIKPKMRAELIGRAKLEVNQHTREYIGLLSEVHSFVRAAAIDADTTNFPVIAAAINRIEDNRRESDFGAYLICKVDGQEKYRRALMHEPFERLDILRRRNHSLQGLAARYVSGELLGTQLR